MSEIITNDNVVIKVSCCGKCGGVVRGAVKHLMTLKSTNEFAKEVMKHNLSVKELSLSDYKEACKNWCSCK